MGISPLASGCIMSRGDQQDREEKKEVCEMMTHEGRLGKTKQNMQIYLGRSYEFGLYFEKNGKLLNGVKQLDEVTIIWSLKC